MARDKSTSRSFKRWCVSSSGFNSTQKRVTERYSASEDAQTLFVAYTLEDAIHLAEPYTGIIEYSRVADDEPMYPFECEVESAELFSRDP